MVASHNMENQLSCHCVTIPPIFDRSWHHVLYKDTWNFHWDDICNMFVRAQWPFNKIYFWDKRPMVIFPLDMAIARRRESPSSSGAIFYSQTGYSEKDSQLLNKYMFVKRRKSRTVSSIRMFLELPCFLHNGYNGSVMQFSLPITVPFSLPLQWQQDLSPYAIIYHVNVQYMPFSIYCSHYQCSYNK